MSGEAEHIEFVRGLSREEIDMIQRVHILYQVVNKDDKESRRDDWVAAEKNMANAGHLGQYARCYGVDLYSCLEAVRSEARESLSEEEWDVLELRDSVFGGSWKQLREGVSRAEDGGIGVLEIAARLQGYEERYDFNIAKKPIDPRHTLGASTSDSFKFIWAFFSKECNSVYRNVDPMSIAEAVSKHSD